MYCSPVSRGVPCIGRPTVFGLYLDMSGNGALDGFAPFAAHLAQQETIPERSVGPNTYRSRV